FFIAQRVHLLLERFQSRLVIRFPNLQERTGRRQCITCKSSHACRFCRTAHPRGKAYLFLFRKFVPRRFEMRNHNQRVSFRHAYRILSCLLFAAGASAARESAAGAVPREPLAFPRAARRSPLAFATRVPISPVRTWSEQIRTPHKTASSQRSLR